MYLCANCGEMFDSPNEVNDFVSEYWGAPVTHTTCVCPSCGSDEFDEMEKCLICRNEWVAPGEELCECCHDLIKDIGDDIRAKARYVSLKYKLDYKEFMNHLIDELEEL